MKVKSLDHFLQALQQNKVVSLTKNGEWHCEGLFLNTLKRLFGCEERRKISVIEQLIEEFDHLESIPVLFSNSFPVVQKVKFSEYLSAGQSLIDSLEKDHSEKITPYKTKLKLRMIALRYRLESSQGGINPTSSNEAHYQSLIALAMEWKNNQPFCDEKTLTQEEILQLRKMSKYPLFIELVIENKELQKEIMNWSLRDQIDITPFIQYPYLQSKIHSCELQGRIGRLGTSYLQIKKESLGKGIQQKIVTMPFEGKEISILDEELVISFRGNYQVSVKEIFEIFRNKKVAAGNLECFIEGITNWNAAQLGWWNAEKSVYEQIDLNQVQWWKQLPLVKVLTNKQAQAHYGHHLDGTCWDILAVATRSTKTLDLYDNHAYLEVVIPLNKGHYAVYDFGKAATNFPTDPFEQVTRVCENFLAAICYPDDNFFYTHREHAFKSFPMTPLQGVRFMDSIKEDIMKAREGNLVYQIESENCAEWTQLKLEVQLGQENVPNLFRLPYLETEPVGAMGKIFNFVKAFPKAIQKDFLMFLHIPLGAKRGRWVMERGAKVWKSMDNHNFWQTADVYLPAFLHKQLEKQSSAFTHQTVPLPGYDTFCEKFLKIIPPPVQSNPIPKPIHVISKQPVCGVFLGKRHWDEVASLLVEV